MRRCAKCLKEKPLAEFPACPHEAKKVRAING